MVAQSILTHAFACFSAGVSAVFDEIKTLLTTIQNETSAHRKEFLSFKSQIEDDVRSLKDDLSILNDSVKGLNTSFQEQLTGQQQMASEITYIKISIGTSQSFMAINSQVVDTKLNTLNSKLELLNIRLPQNQQQTASELTQLQTSLTSTNSKLNTLSITTNQLSTDHQQIIEELSQFQTLWKNLTCIREYMDHNLSNVMDHNVSNITGPYTCGGTGGWRRVVYLNMTDPSTTCPSGWQLTGYSKRTCGRVTHTGTAATCDSVAFPVAGGGYNRVCGRIKAYQYGYPDAFEAYHDGDVTTIDGAYVSGISLTHGSPRLHIWTFAAGSSENEPANSYEDACPCDASTNIRVPSFIGGSYFCESGVNVGRATSDVLYADDPLWDGQNCTSSSTCCSFNTPPYFVKELPTSTTDDIEARLCVLDTDTSDDVAVELIELYVQENIYHSVMGPYTCGGTGGWRRVVYLDMTDPSTTCPSGWQLTGHSKRTCGIVSTQSPDCDSVTFPVSGGEYSRVCGRIKAYQQGLTDGFEAYHDGDVTTIDGAYVSGVSLTHSNPRNHIWTLAAGRSEALPTHEDACPCDASVTVRVPPFVGNDYFCESGQNVGDRDIFHPNDPLWDGQNCTSSSTCCSFNTPPYFVKQLPTSTTDDIEARLCQLDGDYSAVELIELYVQ